jgi:hypothetical protein
VALAALAALAAAAPGFAQTGTVSPFDEDFLSSFPEDATDDAPELSFDLVNEIPLPGPLPGGSPRLIAGDVAIPVAGSVALADWRASAAPRLDGSLLARLAAEPTAQDWVESDDGRFRYRALPEGRIVAEKRCKRCKRGWRKRWSLRVAGSTLSPPLVTPRRIYFTAMDNRLYCLKRKNGHRVWSADVESRVTRGLVRWQVFGGIPGGRDRPELELILVVPDDRSEVQAWHAASGKRVATYPLGESGGRVVGVPLATPDGKLVLARQRYAPGDASLLVLELGPPEPAAEPLESPERPEPPEDDRSGAG